jgi:chemotaxis protein CheD
MPPIAASAPPTPNLYYDRQFESDAAKLLPGEYYVTRQEMVLVTVLGSCVAACIRDRQSGVGGMNHFMLPDSGSERGTPASESARYGAYAMEVLVNELLKLGARRGSLEAKVFGGGAVMSGLTQANVGERNSAFVIEYLQTEQIPLAARDLLDIYPRKVYFFPRTGRVVVRKLKSLHNDTILQREIDYRSKLHGLHVEGDIELFG